MPANPLLVRPLIARQPFANPLSNNRFRSTAASLTALSLALSACAQAPVTLRETPPLPAAQPPAPPVAAVPAAPAYPAAPVSALVDAVSIPYERFTLPNGLTVLVHTDRKAPVVAVSVWYGVGSKNEPRGRTGFAHLFEHLMFYGSTHVQGDFFLPLTQAGATDANGTTWFDRTNYFETVPTGALDRALMMESDRMGFLLDAVTQKRLDAQRAVVQNEKRQGDNQPFGLTEYEQLETLYPTGHPYHHSTIGSMADLDAASLADVKGWFSDHYGPNNALLVLAGDVDLATAKAKVAQWFGEFPAGPKVQPVSAPVPTLPAPVSRTIKDTVATTRISRLWAIPGLDNPDNLALQIGAAVLGGLASSRLDDALVRKSEVAVTASAGAQIFAQAGQFEASVDVKPGIDPARVNAALDAEIARLVSEGPTADELQRAVTRYAATEIRGLESVGGFNGKAPTLAEGLLYSGDPAQYRKRLEAAAKLTPEDVRAVLQKWLTRPAFALTVEPGTRTAGGEARGGDNALPAARPAPAAPPTATLSPPAPRKQLPGPGDLPQLAFPAIERATLSNGIEVLFARRAAVPVVSVRLAFDAGAAADPKTAPGTQALLLQLMDEGTEALEASELARVRERLGASIAAQASADTTAFQLDALTPNLPSSLALLADYVRHPGLRAADLERVRAQQLAAIDAELAEPGDTAERVLFPALYGPDHPYGRAPTGTGSKAVVARLTRADLAAFHDGWLRPDKARIIVAGDTTLAEVTALLEKSFGDWRAPSTPAPVKDLAAAIPTPTPHILLVDRPASPQSMIVAGEVLGQRGTDDLVPLKAANEVLGGNFLARINSNLREAKGWSYGAYSVVSDRTDRVAYRVIAPVQTDKTGAAIAEIRKELSGFLGTKGITAAELGWSTAGSARELAGSFETSGAVLDAVAKIAAYHRPDDFYVRLPERYKAMTAKQLDAVARASLNPANLTWVVVGDAAKVKPQLATLGLPIEVVKAGE
ncbi:M16 family metallopeptidase [Novosphingobium sp.]|uniref:M16 family metallopeptidase n=1 Tax=Novosphingobium sp. TaxID=1874826 RepID=UPI0038B984D2